MRKFNGTFLLECIRQGYCTARSMVGQTGFAGGKQGQENRLLSKKFVWEVSTNIHQKIFDKKYDLHAIKVDDKGEKESGEWLVDACITKGKKRAEFIRKIVFAMESESGTDKPAFNEDFAKLVHVKSSYKLYLNGLDQPTPQKTKDYIEGRLEYAKPFLNKEDADTFYFGFWPSPGKLKSGARESSIWKEIIKRPRKYQHLDQIRLYKFTQGSFQQVQEEQ